MLDCIFTGDIMPGARTVDEVPAGALEKEFSGADLVVGNLECPVTVLPPGTMDLRKIPLWSNAANMKVLTRFGFTHVGLSNNHIYDLFDAGLDETIGLLDNAGIRGFGIEHGGIRQYCRTEVNGITLGMAAVNWVETRFTGHLARDLGELDVPSLKRDCDVLVFLLHWGDDHNIFINADQQAAARRLVEEGVDLVIGHHPHVPQGYEVYKGKYIFYSLGNFIFTPREEYERLPYEIRYEDHRENVLFQRPECKIGIYVRAVFKKTGCGFMEIRPVYREGTLPAPLPERLKPCFDGLVQRMNDQVARSAYELNEAERRNILTRYTLPFILAHPVYWPMFFRKLSIAKALRLINRGRIVKLWKR